jgi:hypothetical protein
MNTSQRIAANERRIAEIEQALRDARARARELPEWALAPLDKHSRATFSRIVACLDFNGSCSCTIGDEGGAYQPLHVERVAPGLYSLAHYFVQNGDLMSDPEGEFYQPYDGGPVYPVSLTQHPVGAYTQALDGLGGTVRVNRRAYRDLCAFGATWLRNIAEQQDLRARVLGE